MSPLPRKLITYSSLCGNRVGQQRCSIERFNRAVLAGLLLPFTFFNLFTLPITDPIGLTRLQIVPYVRSAPPPPNFCFSPFLRYRQITSIISSYRVCTIVMKYLFFRTRKGKRKQTNFFLLYVTLLLILNQKMFLKIVQFFTIRKIINTHLTYHFEDLFIYKKRKQYGF